MYHPRDIAVLFSAEEQEIIIRRHFNTLTTAVKSGLFDFLAHLDFMRKAAVYTQERFMPELDELLKALAVKNMPAEVSSKGLRRSGEPYPALPLIEKCAAAAYRWLFLMMPTMRKIWGPTLIR